MNESNVSSTPSSAEIDVDSTEVELFCWLTEGLGTLVIGLIGVFGNTCSMVLFSKQKVHRIFHHLLLLLSVFDLIYVVCSLLLFSLPKFNKEYDVVYRIYSLPFMLPIAHIGLMGSVYCTLALTVERFLAVCYPFLKHRRGYNSKTFVLPVIIVTLLYNLPKFFELTVTTDMMMQNKTCLEILEAPHYQEYHANCTDDETANVSVPKYQVNIQASDIRANSWYIRYYLVWLNMITQFLIPFVLLIIFNILTYKKILQFEQALSSQVRVSFTNSRRQTVRRIGSSRSMMNSSNAEHDNMEMIQMVPHECSQSIVELQQANSKSSLLTRIKSMRKANGFTRASQRVDDAEEEQVQEEARMMQATSSIVSGQAHSDLRKREVVLAKISIYMVVVLLMCHVIKIVPNIYELVLTYSDREYHPLSAEWPLWIHRVTNVSHFLLTFACSANFYIYFAKHSQRVQRLFKCQRCQGLLNCTKRNQDDFEEQDRQRRFNSSPFNSSVHRNNLSNGRNVSFRV